MKKVSLSNNSINYKRFSWDSLDTVQSSNPQDFSIVPASCAPSSVYLTHQCTAASPAAHQPRLASSSSCYSCIPAACESPLWYRTPACPDPAVSHCVIDLCVCLPELKQTFKISIGSESFLLIHHTTLVQILN